jgi:hypothetical protein
LIDPYLANIIHENPKECWYLLWLISKSIVSESSILEVEHCPELDEVIMAGYVSALDTKGDKRKIMLRDDSGWLILPPKTRSVRKKQHEEYIPSFLQYLAENLGYPIDWGNNIGKYRKLYFSMSKKYSREDILNVCEFSKKNNKEIDLNLFLTETVFNSLRYNMLNPKTDQHTDRVKSANYEGPLEF